MELSFGTELLTLPIIFDKHYFIIPDYQRGYAWEKDQVLDLLKDVEHLMSDGMDLHHYTGTLVLSQPAGFEPGVFHIVDGQQRLTTVIIFIKALSIHLADEQKNAVEIRYIRRGGVGNERHVLRLNTDTRLFHERVVLGDGNTANEPASLESHERLFETRKIIEKWLAEKFASGVSAQKILDTLESKLGFLIYAPKEDAETGIMFEVINNRGKQLSELEKVKNYLIYCCVKLGAHELRETINADWSNVLRNLNDSKKTTSSDEDSFLRYCVAVHFKLNKTDSQYGYDELKKALAIDSAMKDDETKQSAIVKIDNFIKFVKISALWYARLYGRKHDGLDNSIIQTLDQIRAQQQHASIMPLFLALVIKHQGRGENLVKLLKLIEILNFRVYMSRRMTSRNDTGQGDLYYFASRYYHDELLQLNGPDERKIGKQLINSEDLALEYKLVEFILWHAPNERFKSSFILESGSPDDFYDWGGLRYFLMSYEAKLQPNKTIQIDKILRTRQQGKSADYLSIEHLWAQNHRNKPGENDREQDRFQKRRLGNFVLLELRINIQGSDQGLEDKLPLYISKTEATDLFHVRKMDKDARNILKKYETRPRKKNYYFDIHNELNNLQEGRYISFAESRWSVEKYLGYRQCIKNLDAE